MKSELHPRNKHNAGYDIDLLVSHNTTLKPFVTTTPRGDKSIDFTNAEAVKELNRSLLLSHYHIQYWDLPKGHLCPPIPGRVDYIHHVADLLFGKGSIVKTSKIRGLDIGTGANLIYPILGHAEYNWRFVGSEVNTDSIQWAKQIIEKNPKLSDSIKVRRQKNASSILTGLMQSKEHFDFTVCNPPFHSSKEEAIKSNKTKSKKLKIKENLNFGGVNSELWCKGGEVTFINTLLMESEKYQSNILWFTCLVSKKASLDLLLPKFKANKRIKQFKIVEMAQGQKKSRFIAWTYLTNAQIKLWKQNW